MINHTSEIITKHEKYSENNKERLQKWLELDTENYLMSDKVKKRVRKKLVLKYI